MTNVPARVWALLYEGERYEERYYECAITRVTPKFVWIGDMRLSRAELAERGRCIGRYYIDYVVTPPPDAVLVSLAEQTAAWERQKVEILQAHDAFQQAQQLVEEAYRRLDAHRQQQLAAYFKTGVAPEWDNSLKCEFDEAVDARNAAGEGKYRFTISEIERALKEREAEERAVNAEIVAALAADSNDAGPTS